MNIFNWRQRPYLTPTQSELDSNTNTIYLLYCMKVSAKKVQWSENTINTKLGGKNTICACNGHNIRCSEHVGLRLKAYMKDNEISYNMNEYQNVHLMSSNSVLK